MRLPQSSSREVSALRTLKEQRVPEQELRELRRRAREKNLMSRVGRHLSCKAFRSVTICWRHVLWCQNFLAYRSSENLITVWLRNGRWLKAVLGWASNGSERERRAKRQRGAVTRKQNKAVTFMEFSGGGITETKSDMQRRSRGTRGNGR